MATNVEAEIDQILKMIDLGYSLSQPALMKLADYIRKSRQANARRQEMINKLAAVLDERDKMRAPSGDSSGTSRR